MTRRRLVERRARARDGPFFQIKNRFEDPASPPSRRRVVVHPSRRVTRGRCAGVGTSPEGHAAAAAAASSAPSAAAALSPD